MKHIQAEPGGAPGCFGADAVLVLFMEKTSKPPGDDVTVDSAGAFTMRLNIPAIVIALLLATALSPVLADAPPEAADRIAVILRIDGPIGPAIADFIEKALKSPDAQRAALIVLEMDTPGGLAESMRAIIHSILGSPVPVAGFVFPSGSRAASAGTYILYASHIAAMAPGTNLGAATPVRIGTGGLPIPDGKRTPLQGEETPQEQEAPPKDAMTSKIVNDAAAYIRSLAEMRGRNADWAERSVREGASLPVNDALEKGVIDVIAADAADLLRKIDGREVLAGDRRVTLRTAELRLRHIEPDWRTKLLAALTDPNIAFMLILAGVYGLIFEFANPGTVGPGIAGGICLLLGLYALSVLPLNYAGLALLLFAIVLMAAEAFVPAFGVLGIGGIVAFVLAAMMLFDEDVPGFRISWPVIGIAVAVSAGMLIFLLGYIWRTRRLPITTGGEGTVGKAVDVLEWSGTGGYVRLGGERWKAVAAETFAPGDRARVAGMRGLVLVLKGQEPPIYQNGKGEHRR